MKNKTYEELIQDALAVYVPMNAIYKKPYRSPADRAAFGALRHKWSKFAIDIRSEAARRAKQEDYIR